MKNKISVIVPTYNRKDMIKRLLDSFADIECSCPLEFVIIDDCSTDGTGSLFEDWKKTHESAEVISIHLPARSGPARARNAGIRLSTGNILAFTDSDCSVDPHWIENLYLGLIHHPGYAGVGGRVLPLGNDIYSQYNTIFRILEPASENPLRLVGANCMFWKQPVLDAGLFDEYFFHPGGEESALCTKLWVMGYRFGFVQDAIVYHDYRKSLNAFIRTFLHYGAGEKIMIENQLTDYLQCWQYPEGTGNVIALKNNFRFRMSVACHVVSNPFKKIPLFHAMPISLVRKIQLFGLFAIHHVCYHIGRGTFSGVLEKTVHQFILKNPDCLLTLDSGVNPDPPLLEIISETVPEFIKPGRMTRAEVTIKNISHTRWISAEFRISLYCAETNKPLFPSEMPRKLLLSPHAESVFRFRFVLPELEKDPIIHLFLSSPLGVPISNKIEKKIIVTSNPCYLDNEITGTKFPEEMVAGEQVSVSIQIKNTSMVSWSEKNRIRLGSEKNTSGTGALFGDFRIPLPPDAVVPPGSETCFTFRITAPQDPGKYHLRYRMVCENYSWFGKVIDPCIEVKAR
jgi:glycosyltransferase involved in cell wall biosynthesis